MKKHKIIHSALSKSGIIIDRQEAIIEAESRFRASYELGKKLKKTYPDMVEYVIHLKR